MAESERTLVPQDLVQKDKDELKRLKLAYEIHSLNRRFYSAPTFWISAVTAAVAVVGLLGQSVLSELQRRQAQLDRDTAVFATVVAEQRRQRVDSEIATKSEQLASVQEQLAAAQEKLAAAQEQLANVSAKVRALTQAIESQPASKTSVQVRTAARQSQTSLFAVAIYSLGVQAERVAAATNAIREAGYSIIRTESLEHRPDWLSKTAVVLYYDASARTEAEALADILRDTTQMKISVQQGAGRGIPEGAEATSLRVHLVP